MRRHRCVVCLLVALAWVGCDDEEAPGMDASVGVDGGGGVDAGMAPVDCTQTAGSDVFTPPMNLPALTPAEQGRVVSCGRAPSLSAQEIADRARRPYQLPMSAPDNYSGADLTNGAEVVQVLYRTTRRNGDAAFSSGTLYLPMGASNQPLLVHVSGTTGLADDCAPSRGRFTDLERTLYVQIGRGLPVFVPDLAGLGTPGSLAYLEAEDAARSTLDGMKAAMQAAPIGALSGEVFVSGHSAGGQAALAAQALQRTYAPQVNLLGVSALAPVWFDTSVFGDLLNIPGWTVTDPSDGWIAIYAAMYFIGHQAAYDGEAAAYTPIAPTIRDQVRQAFETYCLSPDSDGVDLRIAIAGRAADPMAMPPVSAVTPVAQTVGDLFDSGFRSMLSCGVPMPNICPRYMEREQWQQRFAADRPPLDPMGAPVWFHQGELDTRSTVELMRCVVPEIQMTGVDANVCYYTNTGHGPIAGSAAPWLETWVRALSSGGAGSAPACPDTTSFPVCPSLVDGGVPDAGAGADAGVPDAG